MLENLCLKRRTSDLFGWSTLSTIQSTLKKRIDHPSRGTTTLKKRVDGQEEWIKKGWSEGDPPFRRVGVIGMGSTKVGLNEGGRRVVGYFCLWIFSKERRLKDSDILFKKTLRFKHFTVNQKKLCQSQNGQANLLYWFLKKNLIKRWKVKWNF